jgi:3-dehydroquinate dehydratase-2
MPIMNITIINGPNLQLLGLREPGIYGSTTLEEIYQRLQGVADSLDVKVRFFQSNHEGEIVDRIGDCLGDGTDGIVINPAAYTHSSIAIHDALKAVSLPAVEVHISNISSRESFRNVSMTAPACLGIIAGLGTNGYEWALRAIIKHLKQNRK